MDILLKILQNNRRDLIQQCIHEFHEQGRRCLSQGDFVFDFGIEDLLETIGEHDANWLDLLLENVVNKVARKEMRLSQGLKALSALRKTLLEFTLREEDKENVAKAISEMDGNFVKATERMVELFETTMFQGNDEIRERERQIEELERKTIKFTSKKSRGWVDVGGTRMCLVDIPGGWSNMRNFINLFAGEETYRRVMFEMGLSETFSKKGVQEGVLEHSVQGICDAVDTFSEAGFGDFIINELGFLEGYARITCKDSFEGWAFLNNKKCTDSPVCYYSAGVLLSFMQSIKGRNDLCSTETTCIAKGDALCEFVIGTKEELHQRGIQVAEWGMTIKERAEYLESLLEEKSRVEKELTRKYSELSVLNRISAKLNQSLNLEDVLNFAIGELQNIVGEDKGICIFLLDRKKNELVFTAQKGYSEEFFRYVSRLQIDEGLVGSAVKEKIPLAYDDYPNYPKALKLVVEEAKVKSAMSVPLMAKDRVMGALSIASKTAYHFTSEEVNLLTLIGNQIGVAIENVQLLEEIKESERKYKTLVEEINDGYMMCQDGHVIFANNAFLTMYGYSQEEVLGRNFQEFFLWNQPMERVSSDHNEGKGVSGHLEFQRRHRDGTMLPTEIKINVVDFDGRPAMIGIVRDISERKRMEQKIRESERLASIGQLAAAIAHEIRNPLSAIKMNVQILAKNLNLQGFNKRRLEIAADEIKRLDRIVEDVLDLARPIQMHRIPQDLNKIIQKCIDLLRDIFPNKRVQVIRNMSCTLENIPLDREKMEQAFLNLILNALDAMPNGGVLEIITGKTDYLGRTMVVAEFKDTGVGITSEQMKRIFDPFYTTKSSGVGLGLPNAKKIIEAHDGIIEAESQVAYGTTFRILFPGK